jgi:sporulation protein YlmC with PRC-barrel domain
VSASSAAKLKSRETRATSMSETTEFTIGSEVVCSDGGCGDLKRVVVDPVTRTLTHLVVEPRHRLGAGHLVPIDLVASTAAEEIRLRCTGSEFQALEEAEETQFLPGASGQWGYGQQQMLSWPYYGLGMGGMGVGGIGMGGAMGIGAGPQATTFHRVPVGEVEVRRGEHVHATDGAIGRVQGLVIDPSDHHVTHFLLDEGHLWGQKRVAIPISAVTGVDDGVRLNLTKDDVRDLPAVDVADPG